MRMLLTQRLLLVLLRLMLGNCLLPTAKAQLPAVASKPNPQQIPRQTTVDRIEAELDALASLTFVETPIQDVVEQLKRDYKIPVVLDTEVLDESTVGTDTPITIHLKTVSLRAALAIMLGQLDLTYLVQDNALIITTQAAARRQTFSRQYDVSNLLAPGEPISGLVRALRGSLIAPGFIPQRKVRSGPWKSATSKAAAPPAVRPDAFSGPIPPEVLSVDGMRNVLTVCANYHGHRTTEKLLAELGTELTFAKAKTLPAATANPSTR